VKKTNVQLEKYKAMESQLVIDEHDLDHEAMAQPQRFNDAAKESARAESRAEAAKDNLKTVEAELELELRERAETEGKKSTEATIKAQVQIHPRRKEAYSEYLRAKLDASKFDGLKEAFKDRSFMIRELSGMWLAGYFQKTSIDGTAKQRDEVDYRVAKEALAAERKRRKVRRGHD
jgi:hypothetical protein